MSGPKKIILHGSTATVPLSQGKTAVIDAADLPLVEGHTWSVFTPRSGPQYAVTWIDGKSVYMHRLIFGATQGAEVDHVNGNGLDNRRSNLRGASRSENLANSKMFRNNTSGFRGVTWYAKTNKWTAQITFRRKTMRLGYFHSKEEAHQAYQAAAKRLFGEFGGGRPASLTPVSGAN